MSHNMHTKPNMFYRVTVMCVCTVLYVWACVCVCACVWDVVTQPNCDRLDLSIRLISESLHTIICSINSTFTKSYNTLPAQVQNNKCAPCDKLWLFRNHFVHHPCILLFSSVCHITFPRHKERLFSYVIFPLFIASFPPRSPLSPFLFLLHQPPECCKHHGKWCVCVCLAAALGEWSSRRAQSLEWPPLFPHKTASQCSVYIV